GCSDTRMKKIWGNGLGMGWPVGPHYKKGSNAVQAPRMQGALRLVVGELDRNVDPASTLQVVDALIAADKDFELLVMPGEGHGCAETPYGTRRRRDFFVRKLLGVEPRAE
ncbi:MAG: prolyl oligopeptidase family serine peptidase, partial [Planctomycetes bacterium]|nr:prolyl oligopeptidase family serine peptidase [Planctomycetota bacterium]